MSSLPGGAADKAGNEYEQLWTALRASLIEMRGNCDLAASRLRGGASACDRVAEIVHRAGTGRPTADNGPPTTSFDDFAAWLASTFGSIQGAVPLQRLTTLSGLDLDLVQRYQLIADLEAKLVDPFPAELLDATDTLGDLYDYFVIKSGHR